MKKVKLLEAEIFEDHRGIIRSFYPDEKLVEYNLMTIKSGDARGYHYHPHFDEYMVVAHGTCLFREFGKNETYEHTLRVGDSIKIPKNVAHTFIALEDFKFVSMLTKRWHDSKPPIVKVDHNGNEKQPI